MTMQTSRMKILFLLITIALGILLGWHTLATPTPVPTQADGLSAYRMADHLRVIAAEERSVFHYERRMYVRDYIIDFMEDLGLTAEIDDFTITTEDIARVRRERWGIVVEDDFFYPGRRDVTMYGSNVLFRQQGRSDTAIMLMAHIDSAGVNMSLDPETDVRSPGASDSGYGLAIMLEIAAHFADRELENTIYFFFTDLEEIGLQGAYHAVESMDFGNVSMILNLEARGIRGPVYMFETQAGDLETARFFRDAVPQPLTWSIATAIFREMPNDTDLTPFLDRGFNGMNFAPLNSLVYYHTEYDSYENISHTTMQHYIDQIGALVELFVTDSRFSDINAFDTARTGVYFTLPFGVMILYNDLLAIAISIILFVLVGLTFAVSIKRGQIKLGKAMVWSVVMIGAMLISAAIGWAIGTIAFLPVHDQSSGIALISIEMFIMWPSVAILFALFGLLRIKLSSRFSRNEMVIGAMALLAILNLIITFVMVEATFLTSIPLALTLLCFLLSKIDAVRQKSALSYLLAAIPLLVVVTLLVPIIFTFTLALTVGGLAIIMVLSLLMAITLPALWRGENSKPAALQ